MRCPYCNASLDSDVDYCPNCGRQIPRQRYCANCGEPLDPRARFCPICGTEQNPSGNGKDDHNRDDDNCYEDNNNVENHDDRYDDENYDDGYDDDDDYDWDDDSSGRKWLPLILVIVIAAVAVILIAAWRFGMFDNISGGGRGADVEEAVEQEEDEETEHVYYLNFATQVLDFGEEGLTSRIYYDTDIENPSEIKWTSSDPSVASVDDNGYVTSVGSGRAVITAQWEDVSASCSVACDYKSADVATQTQGTETDGTYHLTFLTQSLQFSEAGLTTRIDLDTDIENQSEIQWSSSNLSVAQVDDNGYVTSVGSGTAVITAQWGNLSAECSVTCSFQSADTDETSEAGSDGYLCPYSSERVITQADLNAIEASDYGTLPAGKSLAQMILNEIYAKHGYLFQTQEIQDYFSRKSWYQNLDSYSADANVIVQRFNDIELQNVQFLNNL